MNRRDFLGRSAVSLGLVALVVPESAYQPCGYLHAEDPYAWDVDHVTLDGERIDHVVELDDVNGWLKHYSDLLQWTPTVARQSPPARYRTGVVRVHWKTRT